MRIADSLVEKLLKATGKFRDEQIADLHQQVAREKRPLQDVVVRNNVISEKELTKLYATEIEVPFIEMNAHEIKREVLKLIPERIARQYRAVVFDIDKDGTKLLAMEDPDDIQAINFLQKQLGEIRVYVAMSSNIQAALDQYRGNISSELTKVISDEEIEEAATEHVNEEDLAEDSPIAQTVNLIIEYGVKGNASDIHIEPREDFVVVRYRVDGVLREANKLPRKVMGALVSRIKILANLKIDEHRAPQDGRFKVQVGGQLYALRVSVMPIVDGEKVVMRILSESSKAATLEELGYWGNALTDIQHALVQPHGMILVTGPTGSGKSTSLFSMLSILNSPSVNIATVEDPVEYRVFGANQTQVNPIAGMTFSNGLRALLRQDPNVIMVGEIRDGETAELAVQAALTGHLVLSTLHTNNAATCLPRLIDMKIEPFLIASTIRVVVGQRLVRRLCIDCRESYIPDTAAKNQIAKTFGLDNASLMKHVHELEKQALEGGIGRDNPSKTNKEDPSQLSTSPGDIVKLWRPHEGGCEHCGGIGYKGRIGIYEVLSNSQEVQKMIMQNETSDTIQQTAMAEGMITMQMDGLIKAFRAQTTVEEILRATTEK
ncbi:MAG TPA: GspE/PulE family protein [Candidatus Saccharimonadales bacterium]|nr:GspE/PulE family protein [Candidatus Saccharimonadales bacterium]